MKPNVRIPGQSVTVMLVIVMFVVVAHGQVLNTRDLVEVDDDGIAGESPQWFIHENFKRGPYPDDDFR